MEAGRFVSKHIKRLIRVMKESDVPTERFERLLGVITPQLSLWDKLHSTGTTIFDRIALELTIVQ